MNILIGSRAITHPDYRKPDDWDVVSDKFSSAGKKNNYEVFDIERNPAMKLLGDHIVDVRLVEGEFMMIPSLSALYTVKASHAAWDIKWNKTMWDISFFQRIGLEVIDELYEALYNGWAKIRAAKPVNLNKKNEEFFTKTVDRKYDHDDLHRATCYYDRPIYERCKRDLSMARIERDLFEALSPTDQVRMAQEEAFAIALERFVIPCSFSPAKSYHLALKKLVTSLSKGWFTKFVITHWNDVKKLEYDYVGEFKRRIA